MIQDAALVGLLPKPPLVTRGAAVTETATSTFLGALDDEDRAMAQLHVQKAAQAADEAWTANNWRDAGAQRPKPDSVRPRTPQLSISV